MSQNYQDNQDERLPIVDAQGQVIGSATRGECHNGRLRPLHPVVHLHLFDLEGRLYLQHRPAWKDIQPDKWDTAVGGHVDWGETIEDALSREVLEEIGLRLTEVPELVDRYVWESPRERELISTFRLVTDARPMPSDELDGGAYFTPEEIKSKMGQSFFTPQFEAEWKRLFNVRSANNCQ